MTPKLPPLPYAGHPMLEWNIEVQDVLHAYGLACWKQGMERAAKVCDDLAARDKLSNYYKVAALAIRKEAR